MESLSHLLSSAAPQPHLQPFIRAYAERDVTLPDSTFIQSVPPCLEHVLEFEFEQPPLIAYTGRPAQLAHRISVVGPHTRTDASLRLRGRVQSFAIFFAPFGFARLFRTPNTELIDSSCDAASLLGPGIHRTLDKLAGCRSFSQRVAAFEQYAGPYAYRACGETAIVRAATMLFRSKGTMRIHSLATQTDLSLRQFERRFAAVAGMPPKAFARISRFQMALDRKVMEPGLSWLAIAHEFGYHDQNHMVRDFRLLCGTSPGGIINQLGDMRPPALAAASPRD